MEETNLEESKIDMNKFNAFINAKIDLSKYDYKKSITKDSNEFKSFVSYLDEKEGVALIKESEEQILINILKCKKYLKYTSDDEEVLKYIKDVESIYIILIHSIKNIYMPILNNYSDQLELHKNNPEMVDTLLIKTYIEKLEEYEKYCCLDYSCHEKREMYDLYYSLLDGFNELLTIKKESKVKKKLIRRREKYSDKEILNSCFYGVSR